MTDTIRQFGGAAVDDDVDSTEADIRATANVMDDLKDALRVEVNVEPIKRIVPTRPNIELEFNPDLEYDLLRSFTRAATRNKRKEFNPLAFAYSVISKTNVGIYIKGRQAFDDQGTPLTIVHRQVWDMLGAADTIQAIRKLYAVDGHMIQAANDVVEAAGYSDEDLEGDDSGPLGI